MERPVLSQTLFSLNVGNAARGKEQKLTPVQVIKIGRKYFTCRPVDGKPHQDRQYYIDTWVEKTEYTQDSKLYRSTQEYEDEKESKDICKLIWDAFEWRRNKPNLSIEKLREIKRIIWES